MSVLYFDRQSVEVIEVPDDKLHQQPLPEQVTPLAQLLVASEFPYQREDFRAKRIINWDDDQVRHVGKLVADELAEFIPPVVLGNTIINRMYNLGIFPGQSYFAARNGRYDGLSDFRNQIQANEAKSRHARKDFDYKNMTIDDCASVILANYNQLIEREDSSQFEGPISKRLLTILNTLDLAPGIRFITKNFGGLNKLNEHLGFPDIPSWERSDFIQYGAAVIQHNGRNSLKAKNIEMLAELHLGPRYATIHRRINWSNFKSLAHDEADKQSAYRNAVTEHYANHVEEGDEEITFEEMARHRALWVVSKHFVRDDMPSIPKQPSQETVDRIIKSIAFRHGKTQAEIETSSHILQVYDDLWPSKPKLRPPILPNGK